jgi:hypothetical protein
MSIGSSISTNGTLPPQLLRDSQPPFSFSQVVNMQVVDLASSAESTPW